LLLHVPRPGTTDCECKLNSRVPVHVHTPATSGVRQGEKSRMRVGQARAGTRTSAEPVQLGDGLQPAHRRLERRGCGRHVQVSSASPVAVKDSQAVVQELRSGAIPCGLNDTRSRWAPRHEAPVPASNAAAALVRLVNVRSTVRSDNVDGRRLRQRKI
jgi:hypothetical protein